MSLNSTQQKAASDRFWQAAADRNALILAEADRIEAASFEPHTAEIEAETAALGKRNPGAAKAILDARAHIASREAATAPTMKTDSLTLVRSAFNALNLRAQAVFVRGGGKVVDDPAKTKVEPALPANTVTRAAFDSLSPRAQSEHCRNGGRIA